MGAHVHREVAHRGDGNLRMKRRRTSKRKRTRRGWEGVLVCCLLSSFDRRPRTPRLGNSGRRGGGGGGECADYLLYFGTATHW